MSKIMEFFTNEDGILSMSRLLMFGGFIVTSILMFKIQMSEGYFGMYIGSYGLTYLGGKAIDATKTKVQK